MRNKSVLFFIVIITSLIGGLYIILVPLKNGISRKLTIASPIPSLASPKKPSPSSTPPQNLSKELEEAVRNELNGTFGSYGIVIQNLKTGERYVQNEHRIYAAGSLYKLWVMAAAYDQIEKGLLREDDMISRDVSFLNREFFIAPELAEQTEGNITFSVQDALYQMITISDNYAALLLADKLTVPNIVTFLKKNGFRESTVGVNGSSPTVTPSDTALFFEKLYKGQLANQTFTAKMVDLLKEQKLNTKIPKYLPEDIRVAHKTGELDDFNHDAGIIYTSQDDYIVVVLSQSEDPALAEERIANVSRAVYNYFAQ